MSAAAAIAPSRKAVKKAPARTVYQGGAIIDNAALFELMRLLHGKPAHIACVMYVLTETLGAYPTKVEVSRPHEIADFYWFATGGAELPDDTEKAKQQLRNYQAAIKDLCEWGIIARESDKRAGFHRYQACISAWKGILIPERKPPASADSHQNDEAEAEDKSEQSAKIQRDTFRLTPGNPRKVKLWNLEHEFRSNVPASVEARCTAAGSLKVDIRVEQAQAGEGEANNRRDYFRQNGHPNGNGAAKNGHREANVGETEVRALLDDYCRRHHGKPLDRIKAAEITAALNASKLPDPLKSYTAVVREKWKRGYQTTPGLLLSLAAELGTEGSPAPNGASVEQVSSPLEDMLRRRREAES